MKSSLSGHFIPSLRGNIFLLLRRPEKPLRMSPACIVIIPPFGEELNRSRRLITEFSTELGTAGYSSAVVDLYGTGDSQGTLQEADWETWRADVVTAFAWLREQGLSITGCLAIRLGCALIADAAQQAGIRLRSSVFWQPLASGRRMIDETLRLGTMATLLRSEPSETVDSLRSRLAHGESLEIGGYTLAPDLVNSLDRVCLFNADPASLGRTLWIDIVRPGASAPYKESRRAASFEARSDHVERIQIEGEPFWMIPEVAANVELIKLSVNACIQTI